jgi:hypothetical protein
MPVMRTLLLLLAVLFAAQGCEQIDPYLREGNWRPNGSNPRNLRAMILVPAELVAAAPSGHAEGVLAAAAVDRLRQDRVRPLPDSALAQIVPVHAPEPAAPPAAAPPGSN